MQDSQTMPKSRMTNGNVAVERHNLVIYDRDEIDGLRDKYRGLAVDLTDLAEQALGRGPYSVVEKTGLAPSGHKHDYWHPAPYWWPDDTKPDGLPYVRRDGKRVPGTRFNDAGSEQYDRTRLKAVFDDTTYLTIAARALGTPRFETHAAALVRTWFITPETRMTPHFRYAQVRMGHNDNEGPGSGIIEFRDVFYFLDSVRMLEESGALAAQEIAAFRDWLSLYAEWLQTSKAGKRECKAVNNHGTFYDVQLGAIAAYLGDQDIADKVCERLLQRLAVQFDLDGSQPQEIARKDVRHYVCFNLYAWTMLARVVGAFGVDLWQMRDAQGRCLENAFAWLIHADRQHKWSESGNAMFLTHRMAPLWHDCQRHYPSLDMVPDYSEVALKRIFYPNFDIVPLWGLTRR